MTFELINITPFAIAFIVIAALAVLLAVGAISEFLFSNHSVRVARHESIPTYYGQLLGAH